MLASEFLGKGVDGISMGAATGYGPAAASEFAGHGEPEAAGAAGDDNGFFHIGNMGVDMTYHEGRDYGNPYSLWYAPQESNRILC